ncbi:MAG: rhodanese-like domain-containing protein [Rhodospirillaceae bacterium]|nr:rhodanese-like domain-containing protein [Rhodospirillaceae bacterium]
MNARVPLMIFALLPLALPAAAEGNRYKLPREYTADISPTAAYLEQQKNRDVVILDVRSVGEYADGHAPKSFNVPFPRVKGAGKDDPAYVEMSPENFVAEVKRLFPKRDTPIITMCQSGGRSVAAANLLAKEGYSNVRSVWTGYAGRPLVDVDGKPVDVNNNGVIHGVTLGEDGKPLTDLGDLDGWAGFNQLPTTTKIDAKRVLPQFRSEYPATKGK